MLPPAVGRTKNGARGRALERLLQHRPCLEPGYGYDEAGRELSRQYSNAAYAWSATAGTTSYAAANSLNQYPTVGGATYSYWPEGPPKAAAGGFNELDYVEQGQLAQAFVNSANAWWFAQTDALGHRMAHWLQPASNTYTLVQESTDGLRPETVMDWVTPYTSGAPGTTIHRDFVLGPDPDEYLAWVDTDGSIRYPMTDREGTVIAQAEAGKAKQISTYDIYGESAAPISEAGPGGAAFPFRYTGQRLDPWTGFLSYKARDYATGLGRFLQPDPAGLEGPNLYEYVLNDPLSAGDPSGERGGHGGNACGPDLSGIEGVGVTASRVGGDSSPGAGASIQASSNDEGSVQSARAQSAQGSELAQNTPQGGVADNRDQSSPNSGLLSYKPGVARATPHLRDELICTVRCTGGDLRVTETSGHHPPGDPHSRGHAADVTTPDARAVMQCAANCGFVYQQNEYVHPSPNSTGGHVHLQDVPGRAGARGPYYPQGSRTSEPAPAAPQ